MAIAWRWRIVLVLALVVSGCTAPGQREKPGVVVPPRPSQPGAVPAPAPPPSRPAVPLSYQDREEHALRERVEGRGVQVIRSGDVIKLVLANSYMFALSSDEIQQPATAVLDDIARVLKEYDKTRVDIKGFTDSTGSFVYNQQLSERRAQRLGAYFLSREIAAARISAVGYGPRYPAANNNTESGRVQNRRVEIELTPVR
jgi:outer membrane protein OmpA-like peptidoglycan-associated protein